MNITIRPLVVTLSLVLALLAFGCGGAETEAENDSATPAAEDTEPAETGEVAYEPAYPEEVSTEELSAEDTAQQHMHEGGEEHMHEGGEEHAHDKAPEDDHGHDH